MKSLKNKNIGLILTLVAVSIFGISVNVAGYGIYLPLLFILIIQFLRDFIEKRPRQLPILDIWLYSAYIIVFFICSLFNGDNDSGRNSLIINYLVCIFIYIAISINVTNKKILDDVVNVIVILLIINCIITILQYFNNTSGWGIWYLFNDTQSLAQAHIIERLDAGSQTIGKGIVFCPGIFPSQVYNGYIVGTLSPFILYKFYKAYTLEKKLLYSAILILVVFSLFVIQQRMAFFLFLTAFAVMLFSINKSLSILLLVLLFLAYSLFSFDLNEEQFGRLVDVEDKNRENLYSDGFDYILDHFWAGGRNDFAKINNLSVHNVFLNAFMYGGLFGAIFIIVIYFRMCISSIRIIVKSIKTGLTGTSMFAYSLLIFNMISLTHNNSLLTGDPIIWVLYGLMLLSLKFEKNGQRA